MVECDSAVGGDGGSVGIPMGRMRWRRSWRSFGRSGSWLLTVHLDAFGLYTAVRYDGSVYKTDMDRLLDSTYSLEFNSWL